MDANKWLLCCMTFAGRVWDSHGSRGGLPARTASSLVAENLVAENRERSADMEHYHPRELVSSREGERGPRAGRSAVLVSGRRFGEYLEAISQWTEEVNCALPQGLKPASFVGLGGTAEEAAEKSPEKVKNNHRG